MDIYQFNSYMRDGANLFIGLSISFFVGAIFFDSSALMALSIACSGVVVGMGITMYKLLSNVYEDYSIGEND